MKDLLTVRFLSRSENESFARMCVAAFIAPLCPTVNELNDVKTAVSEAVTNAIVHGYGSEEGWIEMRVTKDKGFVRIEVMDDGAGIDDVDKAREPFYTTCADGTRSGMGFTVMESFMDSLRVVSAPEEGTRVVMEKKLGAQS